MDALNVVSTKQTLMDPPSLSKKYNANLSGDKQYATWPPIGTNYSFEWYSLLFIARRTAFLHYQYLSRDMTKLTMWLWAQWRLWSDWASAQADLSSLSAWRKLGSLATHWAHSEDSNQTGRMPRLIRVFTGCTLILLVLSCRGSFIFECRHLFVNVRLCFESYSFTVETHMHLLKHGSLQLKWYFRYFVKTRHDCILRFWNCIWYVKQ